MEALDRIEFKDIQFKTSPLHYVIPCEVNQNCTHIPYKLLWNYLCNDLSFTSSKWLAVKPGPHKVFPSPHSLPFFSVSPLLAPFFPHPKSFAFPAPPLPGHHLLPLSSLLPPMAPTLCPTPCLVVHPIRIAAG